MQLIVSDILADLCGLSVVPLASGLAMGLFLWLFGWWCHRFWVVLVATVAAGLLGLNEGPRLNAHPIVLSLLLALAAGLLALALVRLVAFAAGGVAGVIALQHLVPTWDQPVIAFLVCGLLGLVLFRLWFMALTSYLGALVIAHGTLALVNSIGGFNCIAWSEEQTILLNWILGILAFLGLTIQFLMDRGPSRRLRDAGDGGAWFPLFRISSGKKTSRKAA
jgi:hypothetical protein